MKELVKNLLKTWLAVKHGPKLIKRILTPFAVVAVVILAIEGLKRLPDDQTHKPQSLIHTLKSLLN